MPPADDAPLLASPPDGPAVDLVDTPEAGATVIRGSLLRLGGMVLGTAATVASSAVVIRHLGVVDTGRWVTVMSLVAIVGLISDLGLSAIGVREYSVRPPEAGQRFLRNLLGMRAALVVAGLIVALAFAAAADYTATMVLGTLVAGVGMLLFAVQQSLTIPLQARLRLGWVAAFQFLFLVGVALEAVLLVVIGAGLLPFFALWTPITIVLLALTVKVGGSETRILPAIHPRVWRGLLSQILPYSAAVVLSVLYFRVAQVMTSVLSSDTETGYFGVAFRILETATFVPPLLVSSALPILARSAHNDPERFDYAARRLIETMLLAGIGVAVALFLGAEFAVDLIAGSDFSQSVDVLRILAFALMGTFVIAARGYSLLSLGHLRSMLISNAIAFLVVVAAGIPLISERGAIGAAIALLAAELTLAVCYEVALTRSRPQLRPSGGFLSRAALAAAAALVPMLLLGLPSLAAALVGLAIYGGVLIVLGVVPPELRHALLSGNRAKTSRSAL
jgi:O-antigen/teichoic acid export membrane protein